jgi:hypothetical protein
MMSWVEEFNAAQQQEAIDRDRRLYGIRYAPQIRRSQCDHITIDETTGCAWLRDGAMESNIIRRTGACPKCGKPYGRR